jgi:hypothetical protein
MARVIQVIETAEKRGKGVEGDPIRGVIQYWSLDGELLAENDPVDDGPSQTILDGQRLLKEIGGGGGKPVTTFTGGKGF